MVEHTQTIRQVLPTNCFSVFDHFVGLALKGLTSLTFTGCIIQTNKTSIFDTKQGITARLQISGIPAV